MKFVHIADMHLDSPFVNISDKENYGEQRRLEQRRALKEIIEYIKNNNVKYLFISGDFYEQQYIRKTTIEYVNNLFKEIPDTHIFISPGNHDPYIKDSYYNRFSWNSNVKIFNGEIEKFETEDIDIYGFGFSDFYCSDCKIENFKINSQHKTNILIMHGSLNSGNLEDKEYNPLSRKILKEKQFDYIALGHIHKLDYNSENNQNIVYPGSTVSLGFDELGKHGMIVGDITKNSLKLEFIPIDVKEFKLHEIDISDIISKEELIEKINEINFSENEYIELILIGKRNFEINKYDIIKLIENNKVIKIKDMTKINYDLEKISNEGTLKGLFAQNIKNRLEKIDISEEEKELLEKALEIGFQALE